MNSTFILQFQEPIEAKDATLADLSGTETFTKSEEEKDQDERHGMRSRKEMDPILLGTKTGTAAIEEPDQDKSKFAARFSMGTQTITESGEEEDQDEQSHGFSVFP